MIKIAVDAMGGDSAPGEIVKGSVDALRELTGLEIILVGREKEILHEMDQLKDFPHDRIKIINAEEVIDADEQPGLAIRNKKKASMNVAMRLVKDDQAHAVVTAGNTGAFVAGGLFIVGRIKGISRPALAPVIPTLNEDNFMLLDVGAYVDAQPENLLHYGIMGSAYVEKILGKQFPRVSLLNIGTEPAKGNEVTKKAYPLLDKSELNFTGNVEARDIMNGAADVVICDGFVGNIILKFLEGVAGGIFSTLKKEVNKKVVSKIGAVLLLPVLENLKIKMDYTEYGGAPLLGVDGICIKSHGSSDSKTFKNSIINQAYPFSKEKVNERILEEIKK